MAAKSKRVWIWIGGALSSLMCAALLAQSRSVPPADPPLTVEASHCSPVAVSLARLADSRQHAPLPHVSEVSEMPASDANATVEDEEAETAAQPDELSDEDVQQEALVQAEHTFSSEATDGAWASSARQGVEEALANVETFGSVFVPVQCRSTLCRVEYVNKSEESARDTLAAIVRGNIWPGEGMAVHTTDLDGATRVHVYFAKPGARVPRS